MDLGISGKTAIVTAASSGLGEAVAEALAAEGVNMVLFARRKERLDDLAGRLQDRFGVKVVAVGGDMRIIEDVKTLARVASEEFGGPDILILNTGRPPGRMRDVLDEDDDERWKDAYETQLWGAIQVAREITPMIIAKGWGRIVAISSATIKQPMFRHGLSTVFRAGTQGFLRHLANEIAHTGVTVNTVCPGSVETEALRNSYDVKKRAESLPMKRTGSPEELAGTVVFFASRQAGFTTGATLQVDGGQTASLV